MSEASSEARKILPLIEQGILPIPNRNQTVILLRQQIDMHEKIETLEAERINFVKQYRQDTETIATLRQQLADKTAECEGLREDVERLTELDAKHNREVSPFVHLRMDVSDAEKEGNLRSKLIELGWIPPELSENNSVLEAK